VQSAVGATTTTAATTVAENKDSSYNIQQYHWVQKWQ
jgi:hypothetical protein